ncbi:MAG: DUF58 domain-containing protein [Planctomycetota bacterium]
MNKLQRVGSIAAHLLNTDFCPQFNIYVYWLKQPVGWFIVATAACMLVGAFVNPIGWTVAIGLVLLIGLGLVFPWIALRSANVEMHPIVTEVHEQEQVDMEIRVTNRLPIPLIGLTVSGYLSDTELEDDEQTPDLGLSQIPALGTAKFRLRVRPEYRGSYPANRPVSSCGFPFGIWNAKKELTRFTPMLVRPLLVPCTGQMDLLGNKIADVGQGNRPSTVGDFLGVRGFRAGDSLKSIHWAQTAKLDDFVVCERGGPQHQHVLVAVETMPCDGSLSDQRENLAWRVRVAASIVALLGAQHIPFRLRIDDRLISVPEGAEGSRAALDHLAEIPLAGSPDAQPNTANEGRSIRITTRLDSGVADPGWLAIVASCPSTSLRNQDTSVCKMVNLDEDIAFQLNQFIAEMGNAKLVA